MDIYLTDDDILTLLRTWIRHYPSTRAFCLEHAIDPGWMSLVLRGKRPPGPSIAHALGYQAVIRYVPQEGPHG